MMESLCRVASATLRSILSVTLAALVTMRLIRTTWVFPVPWASNGLKLGAGGHGHQITVRIVKADFWNPPATHVFRNCLFSNDHTGVFRVDPDLIQRRAAAFVDQLGLCPVGL